MKSLLLVISFLAFVGCSKDSNKSATPVKVLDTSFLKLGKIGENSAESSVQESSHIHVLTADQNIEILNQNGEIQITNFDYNQLNDNDVIIGNETDQYLFKYNKEDNENHQNPDTIIIRPATINEITRDEKASIKVSITPDIALQASEARSFVDKTVRKSQSDQSSSDAAVAEGETPINPKGLNILNFENYEVVNTNSQVQILGNGLKSGNKTKVSLNAGNELKVTINKGFLELIPTFRGEFNFENINKYNLHSTFDSLVRYEFEVTVETKGRTVGEVSFPLFKEISIPVRVPGPVPVYIDVELEFPAGVKIGTTSAGKLKYLVKSEYALTAQTYFDSETGKQVTSHYDYVINDRQIKKIENNNGYLFELYFEPRMKSKFYRVLGPYAFINSNIQANIQMPLRANEKDIFVNFSGGVGITLDEPIFGATIADVQTPSLFNLSKGWDVIGPNSKEKEIININLQKEIELKVNNLSDKNRITLDLKPANLSMLGKVKIFKRPSFGKLVLANNFASSGLAYYYPPKIIEGKDSFQIQVIEKGIQSKPSRIVINLSKNAKDQAKRPVRKLTDYSNQSLNIDPSDTVSLPSGVFSFTESYPTNEEGGEGECKPAPGVFCVRGKKPEQKDDKLIRNKSFELAHLTLYPTNLCDENEYKLFPKVVFNRHGFFTIKVTPETVDNEVTNRDLIRISTNIEKVLTSTIYASGLYTTNYIIDYRELSRQLEEAIRLSSMHESVDYDFNFSYWNIRTYGNRQRQAKLNRIRVRYSIINEIIQLPYQNPQAEPYGDSFEAEIRLEHYNDHFNLRPANHDFVNSIQESFDRLKADEDALLRRNSDMQDC